MKIYVLNKQNFIKELTERYITDENVIKQFSTAFISINNSDSIDHYFKLQHDNALTLFFDDVTQDHEIGDKINSGEINGVIKRKLKAFSIEDAKSIINFINKNKDVQKFIIHCSAGISRSGAVGLFINDYFQQDYFQFMRDNPKVKPNQLVTKLLKDESTL